MANRNKIQGASIIKRCASDFQTAIKQLSNICGDYTGGALKTLGNQQLTQKINTISNMSVKINENLANAYKAVCALSGQSYILGYGYIIPGHWCGMIAPGLRFGYNFYISVNSEKCDSLHSGIGTIGNKLLDIHSHLSAPLHEMENLIVQDQWVSTLNTLDILFPFNGINKLAHVIKVKNIAISNLKDARKRLKLLQSYVGAAANARHNGGRTLYYTLDDIKTKLVNCEENVKKRMYRLDIRQTSRITENSGTSAEDLQNAVDRLNKKQQEYIYMYGQPSPELAAEIERLKKMMRHTEYNGETYITVSNDFKDFILNQNIEGHKDINGNDFGYDAMYDDDPRFRCNAGCTITACAMAVAMITGKYISPWEWANNYPTQFYCTWKDFNNNGDSIAAAIASLGEGKPCVFYGERKGGGSHAVVIVGIKDGVDPNNVTANDLLIADPWDGKIKTLAEIYGNPCHGTYYTYCG